MVPKKKKHSEADLLAVKPLETFPDLYTRDEELQTVPVEGQYLVLKFGGSSVGSPERLTQAIETILLEHSNLATDINAGPTHLAVVVSAPGDTTDWLIDSTLYASSGDAPTAFEFVSKIEAVAVNNFRACRSFKNGGSQIKDELDEQVAAKIQSLLDPLRQLLLGMSLLRERTPQAVDCVLSFGERLSALVLAQLLCVYDVTAVFVDARTWVITDDHFGQATVDWSVTRKQALFVQQGWGADVAVVTGFIGRTADGRTTTLGRNGSDYTATLLGAALKAYTVVINTDVAGVMTADPKIVPDARPVMHMSYREALELAYYGTRMFHPRTMLPLIETGVPMVIRKTSDPLGPATEISSRGSALDESTDRPTCVTSLEDLSLLEVRSNLIQPPGTLATRVLRCLHEISVEVYLSNESAHGHTVALLVRNPKAEAAAQAIHAELRVEQSSQEVVPVHHIGHVTLVSLVQENIRTNFTIASKFFGALSAREISCLMISSSERAISCVVHAQDTNRAVISVHDAFNFSHQKVSLFVRTHARNFCGKAVASDLVDMIEQQSDSLREHSGIDVTLVGAYNLQTAFCSQGLERTDISSILSQNSIVDGSGTNTRSLSNALDELATLPVPVFVDCSAIPSPELYRQLLTRGIYIIPSNVLSVVTNLDGGRADVLRYGSSCVSSLPILDAVGRASRTGDVITHLECSLSGTMTRVCDLIHKGIALREAVHLCVERKITEMNPWEDLSGRDVARRLTVIAWHMGFHQVKESEVCIFPLIPLELEHLHPWDGTGLDGLLQAMDTYDPNPNPYSEPSANLRTFLGILLAEHNKAHSHTHTRDEVRLRFIATIDTSSPTPPSMSVKCAYVCQGHPMYEMSDSDVCVTISTCRNRGGPVVLRGPDSVVTSRATGLFHDIISVAQQLRAL